MVDTGGKPVGINPSEVTEPVAGYRAWLPRPSNLDSGDCRRRCRRSSNFFTHDENVYRKFGLSEHFLSSV